MVRIIGRLRRRAEFLRAAQQGRKAVFPGLIVQAVPSLPGRSSRAGSAHSDRVLDSALIRVGFTASRAVGGAVARNRARRRLRAVVAEVMPDNARSGYDYVLIARRVTLRCPYEDLRRDLARGLKRLTRPGGRSDEGRAGG